jgi:hypothetical protein
VPLNNSRCPGHEARSNHGVTAMTDCANRKTNAEECPCTSRTCPNRGTCCVCVRQHRQAGNLPACLRHLGRDGKK